MDVRRQGWQRMPELFHHPATPSFRPLRAGISLAQVR